MRTSGILMPVSSLPSAHGIGTFGAAARDFVDFLQKAGQRRWQLLPVGPTGYGDSPYQSFSAFAFNPYFIDLDRLCDEGLLTQEEIAAADMGSDIHRTDYGKLFDNRIPLLKKAASRFEKTQAYSDFEDENASWLYDYALFMALKEENGFKAFSLWDNGIRMRSEKALAEASIRLAAETEFWKTVQYLCRRQWTELKAYANEKGVLLIGDIPIYVSPDSSDLWANPQLFQLDGEGNLSEVAGCPPDGFAADGQLWGNPLYNWRLHAETGYAWWINRLKHAKDVYDIVRIDHFRGFAGYYSIPADSETAINGRWRKGPGVPLIEAVLQKLPDIKIIAEDLGFLTDDVRSLLAHSGFPGMKVLQFAFDSREESDYLPHNYTKNCVVYTGTHDNTTTADWEFSAPAEDSANAAEYLDVHGSFTKCMIRAALASVADTAVIPMQDWLELGADARMNTPGTVSGNWQWRADGAAFTDALAAEIARMSKLYGRSSSKAAVQDD